MTMEIWCVRWVDENGGRHTKCTGRNRRLANEIAFEASVVGAVHTKVWDMMDNFYGDLEDGEKVPV